MRIGIVGGGLIGLACAAECAARGHAVTILDAAPEAREASWAAAGMLAPHHEHDHDGPLYHLTVAALAAYPAFLVDHGLNPADIDLRLDGSWIPCLDASDAVDIDTKEAFLRQHHVACERVQGAALRHQEPAFSHDIDLALQVPGGQVDPRRFCQVLTQRCAALGVTVRYRSEVTRLDGARIHLPDAHLDVDHVVLASGAWTPALAAASGVTLDGEPVKGQLLRLAADNGTLRRFVHCRHAYLVPRRDAGIVVGATTIFSGFDKSADDLANDVLVRQARRLLPGLGQAAILETWTGLRPRLRSGLPCIARLNPSLSIATGHYRNGVLLAPLTARCIAALVADEAPPLALDAFTADAAQRPRAPSAAMPRP